MGYRVLSMKRLSILLLAALSGCIITFQDPNETAGGSSGASQGSQGSQGDEGTSGPQGDESGMPSGDEGGEVNVCTFQCVRQPQQLTMSDLGGPINPDGSSNAVGNDCGNGELVSSYLNTNFHPIACLDFASQPVFNQPPYNTDAGQQAVYELGVCEPPQLVEDVEGIIIAESGASMQRDLVWKHFASLYASYAEDSCVGMLEYNGCAQPEARQQCRARVTNPLRLQLEAETVQLEVVSPQMLEFDPEATLCHPIDEFPMCEEEAVDTTAGTSGGVEGDGGKVLPWGVNPAKHSGCSKDTQICWYTEDLFDGIMDNMSNFIMDGMVLRQTTTPWGDGMRIEKVHRGSPSDSLLDAFGLGVGDVLLSFDGANLGTIEGLEEAFDALLERRSFYPAEVVIDGVYIPNRSFVK